MFNTRASTHLSAGNTLLFRFAGTDSAIGESIAETRRLLRKNASGRPTLTVLDETAAKAWQAAVFPRGRSLLSRETSVRYSAFSHIPKHVHDFARSVPLSRLPDLLHQAKQHLASANLTSAFVSHVKDGKRFSLAPSLGNGIEVCAFLLQAPSDL